MLPGTTPKEVEKENSERISITEVGYRKRQDGETRARSNPVVTVTGLPGSGSETVGAEIARRLGFRFIDDEILKRMCRRLDRSLGELESLEASYRSTWGRILRFLVAPWERYGPYGLGEDEIGVWTSIEFYPPQDYLTKEQYLEGLKDVIGELAREGNVVLHGHGSRVFVPSKARTLHVLVVASETSRRQSVANALGLGLKNAERWLTRADREEVAMYRNLLGSELLDMESYCIVVNTDKLSPEEAAKVVIGALELAGARVWENITDVTPETTVVDGKVTPTPDVGVLRDIDLFVDLTHEEICMVASLGKPLRVPAGRVLGKAGDLGDQLFIITGGSAQLSARSAVGDITVRTVGPGESFPLASLIGAGILITSVEAMTDMELLAIPCPQLRHLCLESPEIGMRIYSAIAEVLGHRYSRTLARLTANAERVLKEADFFANV